MNKLCKKCQQTKPAEQFYPDKSKKTKLSTYCKPCCLMYFKERNKRQVYRKYDQKRTKERRKEFREFIEHLKLNKPCADCGKIYPACCMDFDHIKGVKKFGITNAATNNRNKVIEELSKCELVCANCHRIRTKLRNLLAAPT